MMHYVYFTTNPLIRAGRVSEREWIMETRTNWLSDEWTAGATCPMSLEEIEEFASPQG